MQKRVSVIVSFNAEGQIRPLWFRIPSDGESEPIKVLDASRVSVEPVYANYMTYICQIETRYGRKREVKLCYNKRDTYWELVCNDSASL